MGESDFLAREEVGRFIKETADTEKRPYMVTRSDKPRFCVARVDEKCPFQVRFWRRLDGKFNITRNVAHSCTVFQTTATSTWIKDVVEASITNNAELTTSELRGAISTRARTETC